MNEFYKGVIASLLRKALTGVSAALVTRGWISEDQSTGLLVGLTGLVISIIMSVWSQYGSTLVKLAGLQLPQGATLEDAKRLAKTDSVAPATTPVDETPRPVSSSGSRLPVWLLVALIPALTFGSACATNANPNMSPERRVALYGIQVATYLKEAKTVADTLYAGKALPQPAYEKVLLTLRDGNKAGVDLAKALEVYDTATDNAARTDAVRQVDAALATLNVLLPSVLSEVTGEEGRAKITRVISDVQRLVLTIIRATSPKVGQQLRWRIDERHGLLLAAN